MAHHDEERSPAIERVLEVLTENGLGAMASAMQTLMNEAMKLERSEFLRASPGERTAERVAHANGFKDKHVRSRVGELLLRVPQVRPLPGGEPVSFYPRALERGLGSERALKLAIAEMYMQGVSTRRVTEITRELCGLDVTSVQVSRAAAELDGELSAWRERALGRCAYVLLDARYEKVRHGGAVRDCAVLVALGVREEDGKRLLLGVSVSLSEAEAHWRGFLESLQQRGLRVTTLITSDDHAGPAGRAARCVPERPVAALSVPRAAERAGLRAAGRAAQRGRERSAQRVKRPRPLRRRGAAREARPEVSAHGAEAGRVDGGERAGGPRGVRATRVAPPAPAHGERARARQRGAAPQNARRDAVPERGVAAAARLCARCRDQRGVGDLARLPHDGRRRTADARREEIHETRVRRERRAKNGTLAVTDEKLLDPMIDSRAARKFAPFPGAPLAASAFLRAA